MLAACLAPGAAAAHSAHSAPLHRRRPIFREEDEVEIHEVARALWDAPFAVLAHDVEEGQPDRFCYGNRRALELFECR